MSIKRFVFDLEISVSTVSKALNGYSDVSAKTRQRVNAAANAIGYRRRSAACHAVERSTGTIGVLLPFNAGESEAFYLPLLAGATRLWT